MKRFTIALLLVLMATGLQAQVFNTGQTLGGGNFMVGVNPAIHLSGPSHGFNLYLDGAVGIKSGIDLALKVGIGSTTYFGADVEWGLAKNISLTTGVHSFGDFGLDGTLNVSFPLKSDVMLYSGLDMDIVFGHTITFPVWIPIGVDIGLRNNLSFILEGDIGLTNVSYHIINGGILVYF
jgi:hypothetical protein